MLEGVMDDEQRYQAAASKDARFDGVFFVAVTSTGIYCRPSCPAITPKRTNTRFFRSAAAAQQGGFRACKRCRPDAAPGSPEWNVRADATARAMRLIGDGYVDFAGVTGLADRLGYSQRQLRRMLVTELGAGPLALARAQRAQTARILAETTDLPLGEVAFAAGFSSIRQFNATFHEIFDMSPSEARAKAPRRRGVGGTSGVSGAAADARAATPTPITLRLAYRQPIDAGRLLSFLAARAIPGVEEVTGRTYARSLKLPNDAAILRLTMPDPPAGYVECELVLGDLRDLTTAVQRCRWLLDLDADPGAIDGYLGADPLLGPLVTKVPGRRVPGHVDAREHAMRAVLGQQVSVAAARTLGAKLVAAHGTPLAHPVGTLTHLFPTPEAIAAVDTATLPMPAARARALTGLAAALASGDVALDPGADRADARAQLLALPGIGPWTASYVAMRGLSDPDEFLPSDTGVRDALRRLGADPSDAVTLAESWRPWRSYAVQHLWASIEPGGES
jgi:AraC family transcriptional regulator, regulatory protein of adaptative response / DNA-3-methyladenine glycosylase II